MHTTIQLPRLLQRADRWHGAVRFVLAATVIGAGFYPVAALLFIGGILTTGCFFECGPAQPWFGIPTIAAAGVTASWMVNLLAWSMTPDRARRNGLLDTATVGAVTGLGLALVATTLIWSAVVATVAIAAVVWRRRALLEVLTNWEAAIDGTPAALRKTLIALVVLADLTAVGIVAAIGRCDFAGGRCPDATPLWNQEAVLLAGGWTAAAAVTVVLLARRTRTPTAWAAAVATVLFAALAAA